jgi:protein TonB
VHGALIAVGIAYSFWHIEELSPPLLKVTFLSATPPPPPAAPPPPAGGGSAQKPKVKVKPKVIVQPRPNLVQPPEIPKKEQPAEEPKAEDHGEKDGVKGGTIGGTQGGTIGGTQGGTIGGTKGGTGPPGPPAPPKFLPPNVGQGQRLSGDKGDMPIPLRRPGAVYRVLVKICVSAVGDVDKATITQGSDPLANEEALRVARTFKYRPFLVNGVGAPFCYPHLIEFRTE